MLRRLRRMERSRQIPPFETDVGIEVSMTLHERNYGTQNGKNGPVHRRRQSLRHRQVARFRYRLQASAERVSIARLSLARLLLHRRDRGPGIFVNQTFDRLARLQRL